MARPKDSRGDQPRRESFVERVADELESRFLDATEVATSSTSAEENLAAAVVEAIAGHRDPENVAPPKKAKRAKSKRPAR